MTRNYFVPDPRAYEALFAKVRNEKAIGEVSPVYLAAAHVAPRIKERLPHVKLIALLRHPTQRAYARFVGRSRDGLERRTFSEVIRDERRQPIQRDITFGTYLASGFCYRFLKSYFDHFPAERIRIHLFEDFSRDPKAVVADLFEFLEVDSSFVTATETRYNRSGGLIRNRILRAVWTKTALLRAAAIQPYIPETIRDRVFAKFTEDLDKLSFEPDLEAELNALFREDIERLQDLLDRDLSRWLNRD